MGDGQGVHPDAPAAPLVLDGVVEQDAEDGVDHLGDFLLLVVARADEAEGEHPLLPHGALQQAPGTTAGPGHEGQPPVGWGSPSTRPEAGWL